MSLENEDKHTLDQPAETNSESQKKVKITYSRDFLLSFCELDVCKKLPSGFDQSLLSEFQDAPGDRQKPPGGLSLHSFRRNEYGSSPPTRGESGNFSRGIHGRWDSRSSGRSDRDSDSQSDWDSESGRRFGNQSRRSWQVPEHDGLLGSGSFVRPSGYAAGASAPKFRANDHYQLNRSNEPYHPPRPYKVKIALVCFWQYLTLGGKLMIHTMTKHSVLLNVQVRIEQKRKEREEVKILMTSIAASFEMMRKEQQKAFQEKQKVNPEKRKDEFDIMTLLEDSKDDEGISNKSNQFDKPVMLNAPNADSEKPVLPSQTPASRPLVPPGFSNATLERNIGTKTVTHPPSLEVGSSEHEDGSLHAKGNLLSNGTFDNEDKQSAEQFSSTHPHESMSIHVSANSKSDKVQNLTSGLDVSSKTTGPDGRIYKSSNLLKTFEALEESEGVEVDVEKVTDSKIVSESSQDQSSSILDKLFGNVLTVNGGASNNLVEHHDSKADDMWSPHAVQSSKFAHWFLDEEKKPADELSSGKPNDLLSLIVGSEKGGLQPSDVKATRHISSNFPAQSPELTDRHLASNLTPVTIEYSEQSRDSNINNINKTAPVLTCEDLEQSILSEISTSDATLPSSVQGGSIGESKTEQKKANVDDHASQHLLSLLQKGTGLKDVAPFPGLDIKSLDKQFNVEVANIDNALHDLRDANAENVSDSGKSLTLETLFGTAFMKELQSVGASSSAQRGSVVSSRVDISEIHDGFLSSKVDIGSSRTSYESSILASSQREQIKSDRSKEHLLGFDDCQTEVDSPRLRNELESKLRGFDGPVDIRLPEEDSLIPLADRTKHLKNSSKAEFFPSPAAPVDITEKLAALNSVFGDERPITGQEGSPFLRGSYDPREPDILLHNMQIQPSSPQLHPPLNHLGPLFNPLESHPANINSQMKFMGPEGIIHHDPPPTHQFPANMLRPPFHHSRPGLPGFDPSAHNHHPMLPQMRMPGSFPPAHLLQGFASSPHSNNQMPGFVPDMNPMQGFPFGPRQPNFAGHGMPPPAADAGGGANNPETLQRLLEMELRSNAKQIHPLATAANNQGMYNYELDMGFRYR
ncbi:hypothetical protein Patl1_00499 [Pistacia atlantica]|uniref:Uncharacterized protein n=1 Tax=Pistacia atlantica TaxID=434234 RepID=A0ACC1C812_9ROSI|nr:hypothetical protein Patl1_00499 [Pistacia atlantica]